MSFRELTMIEVREVLRRWQARQGLRAMARETGLDRKTVRRYVEALTALNVTPETVLDDTVVHEVARRVQARPDVAPSEERSQFEDHRQRIVAWLSEKRPLRLTKVHVLLARDHGVTASYATLRRYVQDELGWGLKKPTVRIVDAPAGEEAQVDFGEMGTHVDGLTGQTRKLHVLVVTLCFSRYQFVWPTYLQTTEAVCEGLDAAWAFFGGMPARFIPDNASAMVSKADPLSPVLVPAFLDYVQARGLFVDTARVREPKDKARVENQVAYVRENWWAGESFESLEAMRTSAAHWCREIAGRRVHGTTCAVPREVFEQEEQSLLKPAPSERYDVPHWSTAKVHPDHHVQVLKALYSVPTRYIGMEVRVRADSRTVRIYGKTAELLKAHPRVAAGQRSTDPNDYPAASAPYATRRVDGLVAEAKKRGQSVGAYAEQLLGGPLPWTYMRQGYELIRLCDRYGDARVDAVCERSLEFGVVDVPRIGRMLKQAWCVEASARAEGKVRSLPTSPRFARDVASFATAKEETV